MKIASNGITINIEEKGQGDLPLVFVHHWGGSIHTWHHLTDALSARQRTIAIDLRGWGKSDAPAHGYALADMAADVQGVIDTLNLKRYILIGHSMGGKVAQLLASRQAKELAALVLVAPSPPSPKNLPAEIRQVMLGAYSKREAVEGSIDHVLTAKPLNAADREQVIQDALQGSPQAKEIWPKSTIEEDITTEVSKIRVPTLVIAGELDKIDSPELLQVELLPRIPHATMQVVKGCGHLPMLESPEELLQLINEFTASLHG